MSYVVKDYGTWRPYTPDPLPAWAQNLVTIGGNVVFLKRDGDGVDFYQFRNGKPFATDCVLATTLLDPATGRETVKSVFRDTSMAFPTSQRLLEIDGVDPSIPDPHNLFTEQVYEPATRTFTPQPPAAPPTLCSKLGLKRALGDRWPTVRAAIAADPDMQEEWDLAVQVNRADRLVKKMQATLGLTDDQVTALIIAARAAVA